MQHIQKVQHFEVDEVKDAVDAPLFEAALFLKPKFSCVYLSFALFFVLFMCTSNVCYRTIAGKRNF